MKKVISEALSPCLAGDADETSMVLEIGPDAGGLADRGGGEGATPGP